MKLEAKLRLSATTTLTATSQTVQGCLARMAATVDRAHAKDKSAPPLGLDICHGHVAFAIKKRGNMDDLIWLYGNKGQHSIVMHSVLTNEDHDVLVDTFKSTGKFEAASGYMTPAGEMDLVDVIPVAEFYEDYMNYETLSELRSGTGSDEADKARKEAVNVQIENKKKQIERTSESIEGMQPQQKIQVKKQVNNLRNQMLDLQQQKNEA